MGRPGKKTLWLTSKATDVNVGNVKINPKYLDKLKISSGEKIWVAYAGESVEVVANVSEDIPVEEVHINALDLKVLGVEEGTVICLSK